MTESDWWNLIHDPEHPENADDPDLRVGFAVWLQDECDDLAGAECMRWFVDVSEVHDFQSESGRCRVRTPWLDEESGHWEWYSPASSCYRPSNETPAAWPGAIRRAVSSFSQYQSRRAAEEDILATWRQWRAAERRTAPATEER